MLNREFRNELIKRYARSPEDDSLLARLLDKVDMWQRDGRTPFTRFLSERDRLCCAPVLRALGADEAFFWGGYPEADRSLLILPSEWEDKETLCSVSTGPIVVIRAAWKSGEDLSHRDFLGALTGLGIERGSKIANFLKAVGRNCSGSVENCDLEALRRQIVELLDRSPEENRREIEEVMSSLRARLTSAAELLRQVLRGS